PSQEEDEDEPCRLIGLNDRAVVEEMGVVEIGSLKESKQKPIGDREQDRRQQRQTVLPGGDQRPLRLCGARSAAAQWRSFASAPCGSHCATILPQARCDRRRNKSSTSV